MQRSLKQSNYEVFLDIIKNSFLGKPFDYCGKVYNLEPTMLAPYDLLKKIEEPSSEYERLLKGLKEDFKGNARTEMYRKETGWIAQGVSQRRIKSITVDAKPFLIPILSNPAIGIDTSGLKDSTIIATCYLDNCDAGITFLERHLSLPRAKNPVEYKWNKLNFYYRAKILKNFDFFLNMVSSGLLIIRSNALISPVIPPISVFTNLVEGCFSGYEKMSSQPKGVRENFKQRFFLMCNNTPIHCDDDFGPLPPSKIVRTLVMVLSKKNGITQNFTPLHVPLKSEESKPIQVADIIAGVVGTKINKNENPPSPLSNLFFDGRKINKKARIKGKFAKAYYWFRNDS